MSGQAPLPALPTLADLRSAANSEKSTRAWQEALWQHWSTPEQWPSVLDLYEAAAYRRVSYATIRAQCVPDRKGKAKLRHQRWGAAYRFNKADLDQFGVVEPRT